MSKKADKADQFALYLRAEKIGGWEREYMFAKEIGRRWRFDFAWPNQFIANTFTLAIEIEGITSFGRRRSSCKGCGAPIPGEMILGRHQTAKGMESDCLKYEAALQLGWIVYRITQNHMDDPAVFETIRSLVGEGGKLPAEQGGLDLTAERPF